MRVIVTRVQPQGRHWVKLLQPLHDALALPLIEISALPDTSKLQFAWQHWADYDAVMFVSSHAVDYFFAQKTSLATVEYPPVAIKMRAWATGPSTRAALLAQGVAAGMVDSPPAESGQFDSEALWQQVQDQIAFGARVLIVRGDTLLDDSVVAGTQPGGTSDAGQGVGRDWLAQRLHCVGAQVDFVVAYRRGVPVWMPEHYALATAGSKDGSVWLFSSAEALTNLHKLLPDQGWRDARAVATHPRIAEAARQLGFGVVSESRPTFSSVLASIESLA